MFTRINLVLTCRFEYFVSLIILLCETDWPCFVIRMGLEKKSQRRSRSREREKERDRRDRSRRSRSRSKDREKDRGKKKVEKSKDRSRSRSRERDRHRHRDRKRTPTPWVTHWPVYMCLLFKTVAITLWHWRDEKYQVLLSSDFNL